MTKVVTWKFHVDETTHDIYNIILGIDQLTSLGMDVNFFDNFIIGSDITCEERSAPMVDVSNYNFKLEESFINSYVDKCLEYKSAITATQLVHIIIDCKYKKRPT